MSEARAATIKRWQAVACGLLLLAVACVYWPGRNGGFIFDDYPNIVANEAVHVTTLEPRRWLAAAASSPSRGLPRPLAMLSFAANHYATGTDPVALKLTNIAIHVFNTLLVWLLVRRLLLLAGGRERLGESGAGWAALAVAAGWGLHPINLMPVLLIVQRMESLSHCFVFGGLLFYLYGRERQLRGQRGMPWLLAALVLCPALGALAKESAALLPLYCFLLEACLLRFEAPAGRRDRRLVVAHALLVFLPAMLALAWLLPRSLDPAAFSSRNFGLAERLLTESRVVFDYLRWILLPDLRTLSLYHDDYVVSRALLQPPSTLIALLAVPLLVGLAWWLRRRRPLACLGVLWFFAAHLLTATIIPLELVFEHRNYFASLAVLLALADLLVLAPGNPVLRRAGATVGLAAVLLFALLTSLRVREWSDPLAFAFSESAKHPDSPRAIYYLGWMMTNASRFDPKSPLVEPALAAFERARRLPGANALPDSGALLLAARTGRTLGPEWWEHMQERLALGKIGPQETGALAALVNCQIQRLCEFPPQEMLASFGAAMHHGEKNAEVFNVYANYVWNIAGDHELGLRLWQEALRLEPGEAQYRISVIRALSALGRRQEALAQIELLRLAGRFHQYDATADRLRAALPH